MFPIFHNVPHSYIIVMSNFDLHRIFWCFTWAFFWWIWFRYKLEFQLIHLEQFLRESPSNLKECLTIYQSYWNVPFFWCRQHVFCLLLYFSSPVTSFLILNKFFKQQKYIFLKGVKNSRLHRLFSITTMYWLLPAKKTWVLSWIANLVSISMLIKK